jgi:hypothetical protein
LSVLLPVPHCVDCCSLMLGSVSPPTLFFFYCCLRSSFTMYQTNLEFAILLPPSPQCWIEGLCYHIWLSQLDFVFLFQYQIGCSGLLQISLLIFSFLGFCLKLFWIYRSSLEELISWKCWTFLAGCWWLTPVILATQEAEVRRITFQSQPGQIVQEALSRKTNIITVFLQLGSESWTLTAWALALLKPDDQNSISALQRSNNQEVWPRNTLLKMSWVRWYMSVTPALRRLRQENGKFEASVVCIVAPCLKNNSKGTVSW